MRRNHGFIKLPIYALTIHKLEEGLSHQTNPEVSLDYLLLFILQHSKFRLIIVTTRKWKVLSVSK